MLNKPKTSGRLALRPKSYVVTVWYKSSWPSQVAFEYNYPSIEEGTAHMDWIADQMRGQNGPRGVRKNVIVGSMIVERLRSKLLDKRLPPIAEFIAPGDRKVPEGGRQVLPEYDRPTSPKKPGPTTLVRVK